MYKSFIAAQLAERKEQKLYRSRLQLNSAQGRSINRLNLPRSTHENKKVFLNFCSNDYLGLANDQRIKNAAVDAIQEYGVGAGASHLVNGHHRLHHEVEEYAAQWLGYERALLFGSGYMANLAVISALCSKDDSVFEDKLNHASLIDGGLLSGARLMRYLHNSPASLEKKLTACTQKNALSKKLISTDSVFSMDGDIAPLPELATLAEQHGALLMADDAHAIGVLGNTGAGSREYFSLSAQQLPITVITLGKAVGTYGAIVAASDDIIEYLIQFARPYIYTTALPPAIAAATLSSMQICQHENQHREKLHANIQYFKQQAKNLKLPLQESPTAIQAIILGSNENALLASAILEEKGIWASAIRPPTVPHNTARVRITLSTSHTLKDIDYLLECLQQLPAHILAQ